MDYLSLKWLHILSATLLFGTGLGTAFYLFCVNRSHNLQAIAVVSRWVVRADWWFTTPAIIIQPLTGYFLLKLAGFPLDSFWVLLSTALYVLAGCCWLPVVWLQLQMRDMAQQAANTNQPLPARYWCYERIWFVLGIPAFVGLLLVYWLMVNKPM